MCGIVGLSGSGWPEAQFDELFASIRHRGPNASGATTINGLRIGMHRLHFRGPEAALPVEADGFTCSFNGQVYGVFGENGGYRPAGSGLEEEVRAVRCEPERVDGMYACALASGDGRTTRLTTDPYFIKPLFVRGLSHGVAFCSESGALARLAPRSPIHRGALVDLFAYGWYLTSQSWIDGLHLANRCDFVVEGGGFRQAPRRAAVAAGAAPGGGELRALIRRSVERCVDGRGPFGLAVSGGLDSTILAWELNELGVEGLVTISVRSGEDGDGIDSLEELGLPRGGAWRSWRHRAVRIDDAEFAGLFGESVRRFGHPTNMSSLPLYQRLAEAASEDGVRVLLLGEGADELFGGYGSYRKVPDLSSPVSYYADARRTALLRMLFSDGDLRASAGRFAALYGDRRDIRRIEIEMRLQRLLLRTDVCLMSRSIEGRVPFLHNGIPELALGLDFRALVAGAGKTALREAYADVLGARAGGAKTRFKCSDAALRACLARPSIAARMAGALERVFRLETVRRALHALQTEEGFDADVCCLLLSLAFLMEEGNIDADAG